MAKKKQLSKSKEARRRARKRAGKVPGTRIIRDKRKDPPRAQNPSRMLWDAKGLEPREDS